MPPRRRRKSSGRRRSPPMLRVMPALESYMIANVATQNLMGGNPFQVILGDLNAQSGSGALGQLMGPQPGVISIKELLTGSMNQIGTATTGGAMSVGAGGYTGTLSGQTAITTSATSPIDAIAQNFSSNVGNIIIGTTLTTAGFRVANKVLRKPKSKMNKLLRDVGLGSTVQL
jgi:hypothetical protein